MDNTSRVGAAAAQLEGSVALVQGTVVAGAREVAFLKANELSALVADAEIKINPGTG